MRKEEHRVWVLRAMSTDRLGRVVRAAQDDCSLYNMRHVRGSQRQSLWERDSQTDCRSSHNT
jgi:hypothetical protein